MLREFAEFHCPALGRDEARHNLILGLLDRALANGQSDLRLWTLGGPGACAIQTTPGHAIILGELDAAQCRGFAEETSDLDYPGVVGLDPATPLFVGHAAARGVKFQQPVPQLIQALRERPVHPDAPGSARPVAPADTALFTEWMLAFLREAVPHDPLPSPASLERTIAERRYQFWIVDGEPASMAGIVRRTPHAAAIAGVYTPPALRRRGYAAGATAAVVEAIFAEGRSIACLYSDLRNPASNRCYAKIGFKPVCRAWHYLRA
jgi:RimJ/RimL family protein N-acetyltransferase